MTLARWRTGRKVGLYIVVVWALGWTLFGFLSGIAEGSSWIGLLAHMAFPGFVFLGSVAIARRWGLAGGLTLILDGILAYFVFEPMRSLAGMLVMVIPPVLGGILVLVYGLFPRTHPLNRQPIDPQI